MVGDRGGILRFGLDVASGSQYIGERRCVSLSLLCVAIQSPLVEYDARRMLAVYLGTCCIMGQEYVLAWRFVVVAVVVVVVIVVVGGGGGCGVVVQCIYSNVHAM
jgi:hypothetical protein